MYFLPWDGSAESLNKDIGQQDELKKIFSFFKY